MRSPIVSIKVDDPRDNVFFVIDKIVAFHYNPSDMKTHIFAGGGSEFDEFSYKGDYTGKIIKAIMDGEQNDRSRKDVHRNSKRHIWNRQKE